MVKQGNKNVYSSDVMKAKTNIYIYETNTHIREKYISRIWEDNIIDDWV